MNPTRSEIVFNILRNRFRNASDTVLVKLTDRLQGGWVSGEATARTPPDLESVKIAPPTTLLFVDDNIALVDSATRYMSEIRPHWRFLLGHTLAQARRIYNENSPDAAVLDVELPDGNGLDLLTELRRERPLLPVVMISGIDHEAMRRAVLDRGGYAFLAKPFAAPALVTQIESAISAYRERSPERVAPRNNPNALLLKSASEKYLVFEPKTKKS